jgi:hypothetical protein
VRCDFHRLLRASCVCKRERITSRAIHPIARLDERANARDMTTGSHHVAFMRLPFDYDAFALRVRTTNFDERSRHAERATGNSVRCDLHRLRHTSRARGVVHASRPAPFIRPHASMCEQMPAT